MVVLSYWTDQPTAATKVNLQVIGLSMETHFFHILKSSSVRMPKQSSHNPTPQGVCCIAPKGECSEQVSEAVITMADSSDTGDISEPASKNTRDYIWVNIVISITSWLQICLLQLKCSNFRLSWCKLCFPSDVTCANVHSQEVLRISSATLLELAYCRTWSDLSAGNPHIQLRDPYYYYLDITLV